MRIALVNANRLKPPIAPIGLEYTAEALRREGHNVDLLDLCWEEDPEAAIGRFFADLEFGLVGVTLRNTDDCAFSSRQSFLPEFARAVSAIRASAGAPIVIGGVGFSAIPEEALAFGRADAGIWGDGEFALAELARRIERGEEWLDLPGLVRLHEGRVRRNPPSFPSLEKLPPMERNWVDNGRYFREGGQAGIETKRGCPGRCIYCADPLAKGRRVRPRPPKEVADELERLLAQGIDAVHTCDSEFNIPESHAIEVCREIVRRGLGSRLCLYAYCAPTPFSSELARLMKRAGFGGINFGVDSGDAGMLKRLKRDFAPRDILEAVRLCKGEGIVVMLDLLLGAPGESRESLLNTVEFARGSGADCVGIALGVRVYPETELEPMVKAPSLKAGLVGGQSPESPLFFLDPAIAPFAARLLRERIGDDKRFFFMDPEQPESNYNYNANVVLADAIREGHRGAYWDILRKLRQ